MKVDDRDHSIQDIVNELNALDEYTSNLPESERKHLAGGMTKMAAIIRRLRNETSTSSGEANKMQAVRNSAAIDQIGDISHLNEAAIQAILEASDDYAFLMRPDGRIVAVNNLMAKRFGRSVAEFAGRDIFKELPGNVARFRREKVREILKTKKSLCFEDVNNGITVAHRAFPIFNDRGEIELIAAFGSDIGSYKQARKDLEESEECYRSFLQNFQGIAYKGNMDWTAIFFHGAVEKITGYVEGDFINGNPTWMEIIHPDDIPRIQESIDKIHDEPNYSSSREYRIICRDGSQRWVCDFIRNICDDSGKPVMVQGTIYDITERKAAERELEKSREVYRALAENSPDVIIRYDRQMKCVYANQACKSVLNLYTDDIIGKVPTEMNYDKNKTAKIEKRIRQVFSTGKPFQAEAELEDKEGKLIFDLCMIPEFTSSGEVETVLAIGRDITETKRLQEFTSRAMRLETAGRIAGQVAHDFNNLLGPLMAYPDLITDTLPTQHEALPLIDEMRQAAEQIAEINQQLLTLGRRGHYNLQPLNLNELIDQVIVDIFPVPDTLVIEKKLAADRMNINAGGSQILRALSNLISNARAAMRDIGHLTVTTENFYVDDAALGYGRIRAGEYIKLTITDTGSGMSGDVLARIFEPFYTTKTATRKRGSGLGLSVVHAVIEDHNGYIDCESTIGVGTSMYLYFPITREEAEKPQTDRIVTGSESILVVDDDKIQRDVALTMLKRLGYDAAVAESGEKALKLLSEKRFDLLILDMVMPSGLDGTATYMEALKINPDQKAIIVSGYAESERVSRALNLGIGAFHKKPLMLKTLSHAIRKELDKPIKQPKSV